MLCEITESMKLSNDFLKALLGHSQPIYILASQSGFHPSRISRLLHGEEVLRPHDIRFKLLAEKVGFSGECFEGKK